MEATITAKNSRSSISTSRETTFEHDLRPVRDRDALSRIFTDLCLGLADDLQKKGYAGRTIGLKLRFADFRTVTRDRTLDAPTQHMRVIRRAAGECLKSVNLDRRIRLPGVRASTLEMESDANAQPNPRLFDCAGAYQYTARTEYGESCCKKGWPEEYNQPHRSRDLSSADSMRIGGAV